MAKLKPNQMCPCGSDEKFKKCCQPYLEGKAIEHPERLLRARYTAAAGGLINFLWETLHPNAPRKLNDTFNRFEKDHQILKKLDYQNLSILDGKFENDTARVVYYATIKDPAVPEQDAEAHDVSYLEESEFRVFEGKWLYFDGLRRSVRRLGCTPESIKLGELETLFPWDSGLN
ncbi:MAG: SEC-C domain-containing protein [Deltaproteobacteria bacterium]|nr:SEC-C domain-containing protein [Deltaproteobacteria bacterium]